MNSNPNIVEITLDNAQASLIDESFNRPVLVDFWAEWCAPCKVLMPILEKLANEYDGQLLLAKVDCDAQQDIASQFGVQNLPTVMVIKDGQPVDGFSGAQPEPAIREILEKYLLKPWDLLLQQGKDLINEGQFAAAVNCLKQAAEDSRQRADILIVLASAYLALDRCPEAKDILDTIKLADQNTDYEQLVAQLQLKQEAAKSPELEALETQFKNSPDDLETAYKLAIQYSQHNQHRDALEILLSILRKDINAEDGNVKKCFLDMIKSLGNQDPLASEYQRKLYSILY